MKRGERIGFALGVLFSAGIAIGWSGGLLEGCTPHPLPPLPPPACDLCPMAADAAPPAPAADCGAACANETRLHCPAAVTCAEICPRVAKNQPEYVLCVTGASSCDAVNACHASGASGAIHGPGGGRTGP